MTHRETILAVFNGETVDSIPWVPRIDLWHNARELAGTLPSQFEGMRVEDIHRAMGWPLHKFIAEATRPEKPEYMHHRGIGLFDLKECPFTFEFSSDVDIRVRLESNGAEDMTHVEYHTPVGMVSTVHGSTAEMKKAGASISWVKEHPLKGPDDYKVLAHIFGNLTLKPDYERFNAWREDVGDDGVAVAWGLGIACTSPMHFLQKSFMDATDFYLHHHDYPNQMAELLEALEGVFDQLLDILAGAKADAVMWSANVDDMITYPTLYEEYFLPWCHKAAEIIKPSGAFMVNHPDGENQGLMDLIAESHMDVADAVTPYPMTKVRIEEYYDRWCRPGHLTIHGGIPEMLLLEESSTREDLEMFLDNLFKSIAPGTRFVASIGDTTPPNADFSRLEYIGERIAKDGSLPLKAGDFRPVSQENLDAAKAAVTPQTLDETIAAMDMEKAFEQVTADVLEGEEEDILVHAQELLDQGVSAGDILNKGMLPAMDVIGSRFSDGTVFIPEVLLSARAMNDGLTLLEPYLATSNVKRGGRVLIGTVLGDLHDIGKNMVLSMMKGTGFEVIDMGVNVATKDVVDLVREHRPDIVALSALLTTTMPQMKEIIDALTEAGLRDQVKVIVGGAPVNQMFADLVGADGYAMDAGEAVTVAKEKMQEIEDLRA
ncbi:MAG: corrinoid protein [Alphaproteobacteria bacterium]|jgi:corrinoid protein of di/trimethylamine methyltransferase|nr:corrinoid protein [Alphaproteobacteria bacterium]